MNRWSLDLLQYCEKEVNNGLSKFVFKAPYSLVGSMVSMKGTNLSQKCFEQWTLLRGKLFLELSQEIICGSLALTRRVGLKSHKVPDLGQELDMILVAILVVGEVVGSKEFSVATRSRASAITQNDCTVAASFHSLQ